MKSQMAAKMAAKMADTFHDVTRPALLEHITGFLLKVKTFRNIVT